jgi:hypothetical protein
MTYISLQDPEVGRLMKARSRLGSRAPGYAAVVFGLPIIETYRTQTLATDGTSFFFNRAYVQSVPDDELMFGWFHEGGNKILLHHLRRPSWCSALIWNISCDHPVNILAAKARLKLPDGVLCDWKYDGMTAEQIARLLVKEQKPQPPQPPQPPQGGDEGEGDGQGGSGSDNDTDDDQDQDQDQDDDGEGDASSAVPDFDQPGEIWDAVDDAGERLGGDDLAEAEETLRRDIIVAAAAEKAAGSGTITLDDGVVDAAKAPTVDWVEALADFLNRAYAGEPTLAKPARRHLWEGNYFPSMQGVGGGDLVIAIDTSGSVSQDEAEQFASEIDAIREMIKPDRTCVIYCDDFIQKGRDGQSYDVFDSYEDIEVRAINGGGTSFDPPFHLVDQERLEPHAFIYFTDGWATVKERTADVVDYPVLWATTGKEPSFRGQEFGEVIKLTM